MLVNNLIGAKASQFLNEKKNKIMCKNIIEKHLSNDRS